MDNEENRLEEIKAKAERIAAFLTDHKGIDTTVVDVTGRCSWADFFVITTVTSLGHLRGLASEIWECLNEEQLEVRNRRKTPGTDGWELIDCGDIVIHLMSAELRAFYSLEKLWSAPVSADAEVIPDIEDMEGDGTDEYIEGEDSDPLDDDDDLDILDFGDEEEPEDASEDPDDSEKQ